MDYWRNPVPIKKVAKKNQICFALYTVHNNILKMTVQLYPLSPEDSRQVFLEIQKDGKWQRVSEGIVRENYYTQGGQFEAKAWNLLFRVDNWDTQKDWSYRIVALDGVATYEGTIKKDPIDKEEIVVAAFTGNSRWNKETRMDLVNAVAEQKPDLLFFSGDQVYHHKSHLAEWLIFGAEFGELTRRQHP